MSNPGDPRLGQVPPRRRAPYGRQPWRPEGPREQAVWTAHLSGRLTLGAGGAVPQQDDSD